MWSSRRYVVQGYNYVIIPGVYDPRVFSIRVLVVVELVLDLLDNARLLLLIFALWAGVLVICCLDLGSILGGVDALLFQKT